MHAGGVIAITYASEELPDPYIEAIERAGGRSRPIKASEPVDVEETLDSIGGLLLTGGADIEPRWYGDDVDPAAHVRSRPARDAVELPLLKAALERDMPVLGICRGMQALNVVLGGKLIQDLPGHRAPDPKEPAIREIFIPVGVRLTTILGTAGFMKVNCYHHQGVKLPQKAPGLLVGAYSLKDGIIEALESPAHRWVFGVQWHPERREELPKVFEKLFERFVSATQGEEADAD